MKFILNRFHHRYIWALQSSFMHPEHHEKGVPSSTGDLDSSGRWGGCPTSMRNVWKEGRRESCLSFMRVGHLVGWEWNHCFCQNLFFLFPSSGPYVIQSFTSAVLTNKNHLYGEGFNPKKKKKQKKYGEGDKEECKIILFVLALSTVLVYLSSQFLQCVLNWGSFAILDLTR